MPPETFACMKLNLIALQWPICRYPLGSGGNRVRIPCPNLYYLHLRFYLLFTAEFISLPISSEMSFIWNYFYSSFSSTFYYIFFYSPYFFFGAFYFLSPPTGFSGSPFACQAASRISFNNLPSAYGIWVLIFAM